MITKYADTDERASKSFRLASRVPGIAFSVYLVGILSFGREFALVGISPIYLADVLAVLTVMFSRKKWTSRLTAVGTPRLAVYIIAILGTQSVVRGLTEGYPSALKGGVLAIWPLLSLYIAVWISADNLIAKSTKFLCLPLIGILVATTLGMQTVTASYGLYLSVAVSFAVVSKGKWGSILRWSAWIGAVVLFAESARRGPILAIVVSLCAARIAASPKIKSPLPGIGVIIGVGLLTLIMVNTRASISNMPYIGTSVARVASGFSQPGGEASNNIDIRFKMWRYALQTVNEVSPLFGVGAGHPIMLEYGTTDLSTKEVGPHNSFVGYAFYVGYPAAALVILLWIVSMVRCWRMRNDFVYASAIFGGLVGAAGISLTNVALETTYMGGPTWLLISCGLVLHTGKSEQT